MLLLFTLHVSLDIRQHFNENNDEEQEEKKMKAPKNNKKHLERDFIILQK